MYQQMNLSHIELPSNRKFGFFFTAVFALACAYFFNEASNLVAYSFLVLAALFLAVTILKAEVLLPLNNLWMRFGLLLGMIVSPIVLGIIFFVLFTPISLLMKLFGRDELRLKLSDRTSHWKERSTDATQSEAFKHQF